MPVSRQRGDASARRTLQIALLDQIGFDDVFDRFALLADARGNVVKPHRAAIESVNHGLEQFAIHHVKALRIDVEHRQRGVGDWPASLTADAVYLNGALMATNADGSLPQWPVPGRVVSDPDAAIAVPPWSYGAIVFRGAKAEACG